ncbi:MAG: hypothetical protein IPP35_04765 [Elusimicrobia bacterium]|nr:hypothetical protein [Elusimicrobiota bacterium]MBL0058414.1 hypothetical protein [Elusimicrobiota bacterium]
MAYIVVKFIITVVLVVAVSELSKRSVLGGGLLAFLPLTTFFRDACPGTMKDLAAWVDGSERILSF